jgi:hypothetical protein
VQLEPQVDRIRQVLAGYSDYSQDGRLLGYRLRGVPSRAFLMVLDGISDNVDVTYEFYDKQSNKTKVGRVSLGLTEFPIQTQSIGNDEITCGNVYSTLWHVSATGKRARHSELPVPASLGRPAALSQQRLHPSRIPRSTKSELHRTELGLGIVPGARTSRNTRLIDRDPERVTFTVDNPFGRSRPRARSW